MRSEHDEAYRKAIRWLAARPLTRVQIRDRLTRAGVDPEVVASVLSRLQAQGYADDARFARDFIAAAVGRGRQGPGRIRRDLSRRGVAPEVIAAAWTTTADDVPWEEIAEDLAKRYDKHDPRTPGRLARRLERQGFSGSVIRRILERLEKNPDADNAASE